MLAYRGALITRLGLISRPGRKLTGLSRDASGITLIEVLIASAVVGIAAIGLALMFAHGQAFIAGEGDNRVAVYLAQQKIELSRAQGFTTLTVGTTTELFNSALCSGTCGGVAIVASNAFYTRTTAVDLVCGDNYSATTGCPSTPPQAKRVTVTVQSAPKEARQVILTAVLANR